MHQQADLVHLCYLHSATHKPFSCELQIESFNLKLTFINFQL